MDLSNSLHAFAEQLKRLPPYLLYGSALILLGVTLVVVGILLL